MANRIIDTKEGRGRRKKTGLWYRGGGGVIQVGELENRIITDVQ